MKKIILFLTLILSSLVFANEKPLIVGMELAYPPFECLMKMENQQV